MDAYHMPNPPPPPGRPRRKRQHPEERPPAQQPLSKKQKLSPSRNDNYLPAEFWDHLSELWLTKNSLRELDRRNKQSALEQQPSQRATRKSHVSNCPSIQPAAEFLARRDLRCLEDLKAFARHGGPDLADLKGYPEPPIPLEPTMPPKKSSSRGRKRGVDSALENEAAIDTSATNTSTTNTSAKNTSSADTKSTGPYDAHFQQHLVDNGIYPDLYDFPDGRSTPQPENWEEIRQRLAQRRASLSPPEFTENDFMDFRKAQAHAGKEIAVQRLLINKIEGNVKDDKTISENLQFRNLHWLTNVKLTDGNPDIYHGSRPEQLDPQIRQELTHYIQPTKQGDCPVVPNFFVAIKGPEGTSGIASRQAVYDGALGARGIHALQNYGNEKEVYDGNAYTITSTYVGGTLGIFTIHPAESTNPRLKGRPEYFTNQVGAYALNGSSDSFRQGTRAYRNLRDWCEEQRNAAIAHANDIITYNTSPATTTDPRSRFSSSNPQQRPSQESRTSLAAHEQDRSSNSADEPSADHGNVPAKRSKLLPAGKMPGAGSSAGAGGKAVAESSRSKRGKERE